MVELKTLRGKYMKTLDEILAELDAAEKEYNEKCKEYGVEETSKSKKTQEKDK